MKSYNHLYEYCLSDYNICESISQAKRSKRIRKLIRKRHLSDDVLALDAYDWIINYENSKHRPLKIYDGINHKERVILVPTLEELVVQHCVVNALKPLFSRGMYEHNYASIPKRGAHKGKKVIKKWITKDKKNTKYVLKMDIRHFFDSIPHDILKTKFKKYIRDERMLDLVYKIIDITDSYGLPLGFYTSQWFSNWYLQDLDHFIKESLSAKYYIRYMDDMVVFGDNKYKLHKMKDEIKDFLNFRLGLELKRNWQVFRFDNHNKGRDLDFMGFRFYRNRIVLRRNIMLKASRKAKRIFKKERPTVYDIRQMMSYYGWFSCTNTYCFYYLWIKPYVNFQDMRRRISRSSKFDDMRIYRILISRYI